jgi:hypothetical protein
MRSWRSWNLQETRTLYEPYSRNRQLPGTNDRSNDAAQRDVRGVFIFLVLLALGLLLYRIAKQALQRRHDKWRGQTRHICVRVAELRTALGPTDAACTRNGRLER